MKTTQLALIKTESNEKQMSWCIVLKVTYGSQDFISTKINKIHEDGDKILQGHPPLLILEPDRVLGLQWFAPSHQHNFNSEIDSI